MRMPPFGSMMTASCASGAGLGLTEATSNAGGAAWARKPASAAARKLRNGAGGLAGVVRDDDVGAGAADCRQALEHRALLVEPAVARRGLEHRVLAADLVRGCRIAELHLHPRQHVEVRQRRL